MASNAAHVLKHGMQAEAAGTNQLSATRCLRSRRLTSGLFRLLLLALDDSGLGQQCHSKQTSLTVLLILMYDD